VRVPPSRRKLMSFAKLSVGGVLSAGVRQLEAWCLSAGVQGVPRRKPHLQHALLQRLMPTTPEAQAARKSTKRRSGDISTAKSDRSESLQGVELMRSLRARARSLRCVDGCMCALHAAEHAFALMRLEAIEATLGGTELLPTPEETVPPRFACVAMSRSEADDVLYSQLLAHTRGGAPVTRLGGGSYAVLRCGADEGDYASPGGYSLVKLHVERDSGGVIVRLFPTCTCSSFRGSSSKLGASSLQGGARTCACILMVILAECTDAEIHKAAKETSAYMTAALKVTDRVDGRNRTSTEKQAEFDMLVASYEHGPRLPASLPDDLCLAIEHAKAEVQRAAMGRPLSMCEVYSSGNSAGQFPHIFPQKIQPIACLINATEPVCPECPCDDSGRCVPLMIMKRWNAPSDMVWVWMGQVLQRRQRPLWSCTGVGHHTASKTQWPLGVEWTLQTGLVPTHRCCLYIDLLTVVDVTDLVRAGLHPHAAALHHAKKALTFMARLGVADYELPSPLYLRNGLYKAWYMTDSLTSRSRRGPIPDDPLCLECGNGLRAVGIDGRCGTAINFGKALGKRNASKVSFRKPRQVWTASNPCVCPVVCVCFVLGSGA
jgi:hypothetical protein